MIIQLFHFLLPASPPVSNSSCQLLDVSCCTVLLYFSKSCFCSVAESCSTPCDSMVWSMPGSSAFHYLLEFVQMHAHWISDAMQSSHFLSPPSPSVLSLSQHQGLSQWSQSLLLNTQSSFVIDFLSSSKCLLISWLQSASLMILEPKKIKAATASSLPPSVCHEVMGPDAMILDFFFFEFQVSFFTLLFHLS